MSMVDNLILWTDSYKFSHWQDLVPETEIVSSYFEARPGAMFPETLWVGLQPIIERLVGSVVTQSDVEEAAALAAIHFGNDKIFNRAGWEYIVDKLDGKLPIEIRAVPEGTRVPVGNVLMQVRNTDPNVPWLTQAMESYLTHVWYPSTVATLSRNVKDDILRALELSGTPEAIDFKLQDFGFRGATCTEAAAIGGLGHLVNFMGTDTLVAMALAVDSYGASLDGLAYSVVATEHSIMTQLGREGEHVIVERLLDLHDSGILSVVADSYDVYGFAYNMGTIWKDQILGRDGVFVMRPDSITPEHKTPQALVVALLDILEEGFGTTVNDKGFKVLPPQVRILWGDGIDRDGINLIMDAMLLNEWSVDNMACFGMGGGLLQKVNRDTQRNAFKCSSHFRKDGEWHDIMKDPLDASKVSKAGVLKLVIDDLGDFQTVRVDDVSWCNFEDEMVVVFRNGHMMNTTTFDEVRARSNQ